MERNSYFDILKGMAISSDNVWKDSEDIEYEEKH